MLIHERWVFLIICCFVVLAFNLSISQTGVLVGRLSGQAAACRNGTDGSCSSLDSSQVNSLFVAHDWSACVGAGLSGFLVRKFGVFVNSIVAAVLLLLGESLFTIGPYLVSKTYAYVMMLIGRTFYGFAYSSNMVLSLQVMSHWFFRKELATAYSIYFTAYNIGSILALTSVGAMLEQYNLQITLWITFAICLLGPIGSVTAGYIYKRYASRQMEVQIVYKHSTENRFDFHKVGSLTFDFWILCIICALYNIATIGAIADFPKYLLEARGYNEAEAGQVSGINPGLAVLSPVFGFIIDRYGYRDVITSLSTGALFIVFLCQTLLPSFPPVVTLIFLGLTFAACSASVWSSISIVECPSVVGLALGIASACDKLAVGSVLLGTGFLLKELGDYRWQVFFSVYSGCAGVAFLLSILSAWSDWKNGKSRLRKPHAESDSLKKPQGDIKLQN